MLPEHNQVAGTCRHCRNARARERDLRGGSKNDRQIDIACFFAFLIKIEEVIRGVGQIMDAVGVIPHDAEIFRGGLECGKTAHCLVGISDAERIGILRHTPDSLDALIAGYQLFHHIHVRAGGEHRDGDKLHAEILCDSKVTVISGRRAQEFDVTLTAPRLASREAVRHAAGNKIEHHVQAGISADNHVFRLYSHHLRENITHFRQAVRHTVVAAVHPGGRHHIRR